MSDFELSKPTEEELAMLGRGEQFGGGAVQRLLREFAESGESTAVVYRNGSAADARLKAILLGGTLKRLEMQAEVRVIQRKSIVFLVRKDAPTP